jgi:hypothetical protein
MAMETTVLLRTILYQAMMSGDVDDIIRSIKVMCTKDDIAAVEQAVTEAKKKASSNISE